ncbi:DNA-binding transcriptional regulator YbjK [Crossiella equi]|uniref:DNA-binding transcriptional regulator YbjK n=1 Tax=Crossiella equi TaxID=130796 RepID=A0ABS5ANV9_9PSEU|nr:TetR/AcrR family transcriptional regulator [Crossiella equi]MBP2478252.1 DNA-binding transcriptional regulator YbjK [Crossiella equi]
MPPQNEQRKRALADAAIEILARDGGHGLTHRAVDREAGVPTGTASNYFRTRDALWAGVSARIVERHWEILGTIEGFPERLADPEGASEAIATMLSGGEGWARTYNLALTELSLEAVRRPGLRPVLHELNEVVTSQMAANHRANSLPEDRETLDVIAIFLRGLQLSMLMPWVLGRPDYRPALLIERVYESVLGSAPRHPPVTERQDSQSAGVSTSRPSAP